MFKPFLIYIMLTFTFVTNFAFADSSMGMFYPQKPKSKFEKVREYIKPSEVYFTETEICIEHEGDFVEVNSVSADNNGLFIMSAFPSGKRPWQCPECGRVNDRAVVFCERCNWPDND